MLSSMRARREPPPPQPPPRSQERQALAEAIATRDHFAREVEADAKAIDVLREQRRGDGLEKAVALARADVETAKANAAKYLTDAAIGEAGDPPRSVKDARAAVQQAEDDLEASNAAWTGLLAKQEFDKDKLTWWTGRVRERVSRVASVDPQLRKLVADFRELQRRVAEKRLFLSLLSSHMPRDLNWSDVPLFKPGELHDDTGPWRAALADLENNPDAQLPAQ